MTRHSTPAQSATRRAQLSDPLCEIVEILTDKLIQRDQSGIEQVLAQQRPGDADRLRALLPALEVLAEIGAGALAGNEYGLPISNGTANPTLPPFVRGGQGGSGLASAHESVDRTPAIGLLGDFRILREIGRGGMGVVYEAEQVSLGRRVALKVLPLAGVLDSRQLERFKNEARAAAGLHHPHIVPIHAVGCDRGVHYYAMQYIEGQTLADVIHGMSVPASRGRQPSDGVEEVEQGMPNDEILIPTEVGKEIRNPKSEVQNSPSTLRLFDSATFSASASRFRTIADWGIQIAEALDYAHSLGVIHRDIKPANLMLDACGKVWVTDFGLARLEADAGLTMTGDIVGTLRYASPEQALGARGLVDQRSDVYSLGATLYELITLRPVFPVQDRARLLQQVAHEDPISPRKVSADIPVELDTIILKSLDKDPDRRYTTARDLADDLRRFLHDQPIKARPATAGDRFRKWARRNRPVAASAFGAMVLTVLVLAVSTIWVIGERDAAREAETREHAQADKAREQAALATQRQRDAEASQQLAEIRQRETQEMLATARDVVDNMLTRTSDKFGNQPRMRPVRKELLERASAFYERFVQDDSTDPGARLQKGRAYRRVGWIQSLKQEPGQALEMFRRSVSVFDGLFRDFPGKLEHGDEFILSLTELAKALDRAERSDDAEKTAERAYSVSHEFLSRFAPDARARIQFAWHTSHIGAVLMGDRSSPNRVRRALELGRVSIQTLEDLTRDYPENSDYHGRLSEAYKGLYWSQPSVELIRKICDFDRTMVARFGNSSLPALAQSLSFYALYLELPGRDFEAAERAFREALATWREFKNRYPNRHAYNCAESHAFFAQFLWRLGRLKETEEAVRPALAELAALRTAGDDSERVRHIEGLMHFWLAGVLHGQGRADESWAPLQEGMAIYSELLKDFPDSNLYRHNLGGGYRGRALFLTSQGRPQEAEKALREAISLRTELATAEAAGSRTWADLWYEQKVYAVNQEPVPNQRWCVVQDSLALSELLRKMGQAPDAQEVCRSALAFAEALVKFWPGDAEPEELLRRIRAGMEESVESREGSSDLRFDRFE